jgi:type II secretory pathway component GspD/PulD (secretin)
MRNKFNIVVAATLMTGAAYAQESQEFEQIVNQLTAESVAVEAVVADVPAMIEESRSKFLDGKFAQAQQGFNEVVKIDPANKTARMYLRSLLERDMSAANAAAIKDVDAAWCTAVSMRTYALAEDAMDTLELEDVKETTSVVDLFPQVDFPEGTSAVYQPEMKALFVRNTKANFEVLEAILDAMEVLKDSDPSDQVEIEAKFVEVTEGTLEELGFQWNLDGTLANGNYEFNDGGGLFRNSLRGSPLNSDSSLPFSANADGRAAATGDWASFDMLDALSTTAPAITLSQSGGTPIDLMISALDQSNGANVLSAPRVTTKSGEEATIRVGEQHFFPEVYEIDTADATIPHIAYVDFEEIVLGVELSVTPEVEDENITLALNPRIKELAGWQEYLATEAGNSVYGHRQAAKAAPYIQATASVAKLPILKTREIETEVTIRSGNTIGMGGLISESVEAFEDKVPVLGDLPLVGRLFRNEGERSVKRNLLMFVTAKVVEPSGYVKTTRSFE